MDRFVNSVKRLVKGDFVVIDNNIFRLHYKYTSCLLLLFSMMVTTKQIVMEPIGCFPGTDRAIPEKVINSFCWVHSTFSITEAWDKKIGQEVPYPGIANQNPKDHSVYHAYYQYVGLVLLLQAALFYIPRHLWKSLEGRRLKSIMQELANPILDPCKKESQVKALAAYIETSLGKHKMYVYYFLLCEFLNVLNVVGQFYLLDAFFGGEFSNYGAKVYTFSGWLMSVQYDPMMKRFPRVAKCQFHMFGDSGDVERHDVMCVLPINVMNEKIFLFEWFWFLTLVFLSVVILILHLFLIVSPKARVMFLRAKARLVRASDVERILQRCDVSDWFFLYQLAKNLDCHNFNDVAKELVRMSGKKEKESA